MAFADLTTEQQSIIAVAFQAILTTYQTEALRQLYVKIAGMINTIG